MREVTLDQAIHAILVERQGIPAERSLLVGISGIDGGGKGYVFTGDNPFAAADLLLPNDPQIMRGDQAPAA
jgi:hypothetical protein